MLEPNVIAMANDIAATLNETDALVQETISWLVQICGQDFIHNILQETMRIESAGGLLTRDGTRRRTPGGTFFFLVRGKLTKNRRRYHQQLDQLKEYCPSFYSRLTPYLKTH